MNGTNVDALVTTGLTNPVGIAVEPAAAGQTVPSLSVWVLVAPAALLAMAAIYARRRVPGKTSAG